MIATGVPTKFPIIWAAGAGPSYVHQVPTPSQAGGNASLTDGFPPICFLPVGAGGLPPEGIDFNGILQQLSAWSQWFSAGGPIAWDNTFSSQIGGYPSGAVVLGTNGTWYQSTVDANATNPNTGGAGWIPYGAVRQTRVITTSGVFTTNAIDYAIGLARTSAPAVSSTTLPDLPVGQEIWYEDLAANFQAFPVTVNPFAGTTIAGLGQAVLNVNRQCARFRRYDGNIWSFRQ